MPERLKAAKDEVTAMIQRSVIPKWGTFIFLVPAPGQWDTSVWYLTSCRRLQRLTHPGVGTGKQQKESLTGEQEICVLSVASVVRNGPQDILSSTTCQRTWSLQSYTLTQSASDLMRFIGGIEERGKSWRWVCQEDNVDNCVGDFQEFPLRFL